MSIEFIYPIALLIIGIGGIIYSFMVVSKAIDSEEWEVVEGSIIDKSIIDVPVHSNYIISSDNRFYSSTRTFMPVIRYQYFYKGQKYTGDAIRIGGSISSSFRSQTVNSLERYKIGNKVKVYVRSDNPEECVLEPGLHAGMLIPFIVFCVFLGFGVHSLLPLLGIDSLL